jgi:hypothetical protein
MSLECEAHMEARRMVAESSVVVALRAGCVLRVRWTILCSGLAVGGFGEASDCEIRTMAPTWPPPSSRLEVLQELSLVSWLQVISAFFVRLCRIINIEDCVHHFDVEAQGFTSISEKKITNFHHNPFDT